MHSKRHNIAWGAVLASTLVRGTPVAQVFPGIGEAGLITVETTISNIDCGLYATAFIHDVNKNTVNLKKKEGAAKVSAGECVRVGCFNTSGLYICNDLGEDVEIEHSTIGQMSSWLSNTCYGHGSNNALSGRMSTEQGWNLNIGYCNGNDAVSIPPNEYEYPGPEGGPGVHCGLGKDAQCSFGNCDPDTIEIEVQESVVCGEFLGPAYIGPGATYTYATSRNVGQTWSVGGFLSIDTSDLATVAASAGFFASFAETTTMGDTVGTAQVCGEEGATGNWTCGMDIAPKCWQMTGSCEASFSEQSLGRLPWASIAPQQEEGDDQGVYTANICVCPNCEGADEDGVPEYVCNLDCATCNTPSEGT